MFARVAATVIGLTVPAVAHGPKASQRAFLLVPLIDSRVLTPARFYRLALRLRDAEDVPDVESDHILNAQWQAIDDRFTSWSFSDYASVFDPRLAAR